MKVNLKQDWSSGEGRYRQRNNPNEIPDELFKQLPSTAEVIEAPKPKRVKKPEAKEEDK